MALKNNQTVTTKRVFPSQSRSLDGLLVLHIDPQDLSLHWTPNGSAHDPPTGRWTMPATIAKTTTTAAVQAQG